jgi:HD-GYP domain-containing protein (c-di-GMP phosphodiesterase class II)
MKQGLFNHTDPFSALNRPGSLGEKLSFLHQQIQTQHPFITRIAIAVYDENSDLLSTFIWSSEQSSPLVNYQAKLANSRSLSEILEQGKPRVVNNMGIFVEGENQHTQVLNDSALKASYTMPLYQENRFMGFVFFNAEQTDVFQEHILVELDMIGHIISLLLQNELSKVQTLLATVKSAQAMTHTRDPETGAHLDRMSRYARLIGRELAESHQLNDDYIEHLFLFAPLHDLGKIGIPDDILLKPGKLDEPEFDVMKTHTTMGHTIIDHLIDNYGFSGVSHINMLRNIALHHHEAINGTGYPGKLKSSNIPLEARIVAVADVFDALTSNRPYKPAWNNDKAFAKLKELAGTTLDEDCVNAMFKCRQEVESIQKDFQENAFG